MHIQVQLHLHKRSQDLLRTGVNLSLTQNLPESSYHVDLKNLAAPASAAGLETLPYHGLESSIE